MKRIKTEMSKNIPLTQNITNIIIEHCEKINEQLQQGNYKNIQALMAKLDKDKILLHHTHPQYNRLHSLILNMKAACSRKRGDYEQALKYIQEAISIQRQGHVDAIDMSRTLLNKSVIMGRMAQIQEKKKQQNNKGEEQDVVNQEKSSIYGVNNLYSHQQAINLVKQALQLIKNRPNNKILVHKDQYKLAQLIIISFHNVATEMTYLSNSKQAYHLYKKAYQISLRMLGHRHHLTQYLKIIVAKNRQNFKNNQILNKEKIKISINSASINHSQTKQKVKKNRRFITEQSIQIQRPQSNILVRQDPDAQKIVQEQKSNHFPSRNITAQTFQRKLNTVQVQDKNNSLSKKKYKSFFKAYGFSEEIGKNQKEKIKKQNQKKTKNNNLEMKELPKLQKIYRPKQEKNKSNSTTKKNFINKKKIKDIIMEEKQLMINNIQNTKQQKNNNISNITDLIPTQYSQKKDNQDKDIKQLTHNFLNSTNEDNIEEKGCQLI